MIWNLWTRLFAPKRQMCCGVEIIEDEDPTARTAAQASACGCTTGQSAKRSTHIPLIPVVYAANAFLIKRAEMLRSIPGNPYDVQVKHHGLVTGILVGRARTPVLNRVFGANIDDADLTAEFDQWFAQARATPAYQVLEPSEQPATPPFGFVKVEGWDHVILERNDLDGEPEVVSEDNAANGLQIDEVSRTDTETFVRIYAEAFNYPSSIVQPLCRSVEMLIDQPEVRTYVVKASGEPIAVGQLFFSEYGAAFLGSTGTLPAARRLGSQALLDHRRLIDARAAGYRRLCRTVALSSASWRNALRAGFHTVYREAVYAPAVNVTQQKAHEAGCCTVEFAGVPSR
jgi:hypothetical protein